MTTKYSLSLLLFLIINQPIYVYSAESEKSANEIQADIDRSNTIGLEKAKAEAEKAKAEAEKAKAEAEILKFNAEAAKIEAARIEAEKTKADAEAAKIEAAKIEVEKFKAVAEKAKDEVEKAKAEAVKAISDAERLKADAAVVNAEKNLAKAETEKAKAEATAIKAEKDANDRIAAETQEKLNKFGFGPAFFIVNYRDKILTDSKEVTIKGDGTISSKGTEYVANFGFEVHYDFSFWPNKIPSHSNGSIVTSHVASPFLGLYDISNGINGIAVGVMYGYKKLHFDGSGKETNGLTLNTGLGWTVHKNQLVLADGIRDGAVPSAALQPSDYTTRKDVMGLTLMISANMGF